MSSIPRGPNHDDAAEPPTPGTNLPRPSLDQTLVGVAPSALTNPPLTPAPSAAEEAPEAAQPATTEKPHAIIATPMIAVSGDAPEQQLDELARPDVVGMPRGPSRADVDPALQSTALASDYLQAARDAALRKASVPRPRRPAAPALEPPSAATLHVTGDVPAGEPTNVSASDGPMAAPPRSSGTQASVAPPLEAGETEHGVQAPSPPTYKVDAANTLAAHGGAPAQPSIRRFEPVPTVRAPLWEQAPPSVGRPLTLDNEVPDWEPLRAGPPPLEAHTGPRSRWYRLRWVALAAAVLTAVAFAVLGEQLTRAPEGRVKLAETAAQPPTKPQAPNAAPPEQTLLSNRPASEPITAPVVAHLPATATSAAATPAPEESVSTPGIAPATAAPAAATSSAVVASKGKKKAVKRSKPKRKRAATPASEPALAEPK